MKLINLVLLALVGSSYGRLMHIGGRALLQDLTCDGTANDACDPLYYCQEDILNPGTYLGCTLCTVCDSGFDANDAACDGTDGVDRDCQDCTVCDSGFDANDAACDGTDGVDRDCQDCTVCDSGFDANDAACDGTDGVDRDCQDCTVCDSGFDANDAACDGTDGVDRDCQDCTVCDSGFDANDAACDGTDGVDRDCQDCTVCDSGFDANDAACDGTDGVDRDCQDCTVCDSGFDANDAACDGTDGVDRDCQDCTVCDAGTFDANDAACDGTDGVDRDCQPCPEECASCHFEGGEPVCDTCNTGYYDSDAAEDVVTCEPCGDAFTGCQECHLSGVDVVCDTCAKHWYDSDFFTPDVIESCIKCPQLPEPFGSFSTISKSYTFTATSGLTTDLTVENPCKVLTPGAIYIQSYCGNRAEVESAYKSSEKGDSGCFKCPATNVKNCKLVTCAINGDSLDSTCSQCSTGYGLCVKVGTPSLTSCVKKSSKGTITCPTGYIAAV